MKFRIGPAIAGTMAVAAATLIATAGPASADIPPGINWDHTWSATGVKVYVEEHGDIVSVCDTKVNGDPAYVHVADYNSVYYAYATHGAGTCTTHDAGDGGYYNLNEGDGIEIQIWGESGQAYSYHYYINDH